MDELDYLLPPELIATAPANPRDHSRLMVIHRRSAAIEHRHFFDLPEYLLPTDLLIVNDTRVIPAKLILHKHTGGQVPGLFLAEPAPGTWEALLRTRGKATVGDELIAGRFRFRLHERLPQKGMWRLTVHPPLDAPAILAEIGHVPLPPYIEKMRNPTNLDDTLDRTHYQTIYADAGKSVAAPTAGLHFTAALLAKIHDLGIHRATINLEVGMGTFLPVETQTLEDHLMHLENFSIPAHTIELLRHQRTTAHRIIVVGTTAVRALESAAAQILNPSTTPADIHAATQLKISPGYTFRLTDALLTNFHLPRSTLMALVAALLPSPGIDRLKDLYALAIRERYRFYSYGDAMLLLP